MKIKKIKNLLLLTSLFFISFCGGQEIIEETTELTTSTTATIQETTTTTTTSLVIQEVTENDCIPDDNTGTNTESKKAVQQFLNKYGFNAGEEDGFFGYKSTEALRRFQAYAGINPDGDLGPVTKSTIKNWTGCEEEINTYVPSSTTTTVLASEDNQESTPSTTSTTIGTVEVSNDQSISNYGFIPSISIDDNNLISIFKGVANSKLLCGTPYYNTVPNDALNYLANGIISENTINPSVYSQSSNTAKILTNTNENFVIEVLGNGDSLFNFYFIPPFSNQTTLIKPTTIDVSSGKTIATFNKDGLESGYWFFAYAENQSGRVIKSSSPREFTVGNFSDQTYTGSIETEILNFNINGRNVGGGQALSSSDTISISYITKGIYDEKPDTSKDIQKDDTEITLINNEQADPGDLLVINNEIMKVLSKNDSKYKVQRGFYNTEPKKHLSGASVKQIKNLDVKRANSTYATLILRSESGKKFQVRLNGEIINHTFSINGCPNDRYLFEEIKTFSWREQGKSVVASNSIVNSTGSIFNKSFIVNELNNDYIPPILNSTNVDSEQFANNGPRNIDFSAGSDVIFNFSGLQQGSSSIDFIEISFQMLPTSGSSKSSTSRSVFFPVNDDMEFIINIDSITTGKAYKSTEWESGYRYIFSELNVFDQITKTKFKSNGQVSFDDQRSNTTHNVYYLDQFSFNIP